MDVGERRRARRAAGKNVESLTGAVSVAKIELSARRGANCVAASCPVSDVGGALRLANGGGVVVRDVERGPLHSAVEHGSPFCRQGAATWTLTAHGGHMFGVKTIFASQPARPQTRRRLSSGNGYSIWHAVARPTASPKQLATTRSAMSIPAEIPADVNTWPSSTT